MLSIKSAPSAGNNRIQVRSFLNRYCAPDSYLESMLLTRPSKKCFSTASVNCRPVQKLSLAASLRSLSGALVLCPALSSGWQTWWASEYGLGDYYLHLPPGKPVDEQFVVRLSLKEWQWKLSGIDLPEPMRMQLAQEIIKQQKKKEE